MKILFVCRGNVGRSQMAEVIFNQLASAGFIATSVGTKVRDKDGNSMDGQRLIDLEGAKSVVSVLKEVGGETGLMTRNQISEQLFADSDMVIVMAEKETWPEYLANDNKVRYWEIADPKGKGIEEVKLIYNQIDELVRKLIAELN